MEDLVTIREKINQMSQLTLAMLKTAFDGFMKHDLEILSAVLKDEERLNEMEKVLTVSLVDISKASRPTDKKNIVLLANIVADLEKIGDYVKDMIERVEIKIEEKLLFSEEALNEYKHLYQVVETEFADVDKALEMNDKSFAQKVLCSQEHADNLAQKYRDTHAQRLILGVCLPRACNMFLDLLDFTAQISRHTKAIAKNILELK